MNWQQELDYFRPLTEQDHYMFASPREVEKAVTVYNRYLRLYRRHKLPSVEKFRELTDAYPLFVEPAQFYAIIKAQSGDYRTAAKYLEQVSLLELDEKKRRIVSRQRKLVQQLVRADAKNVKRREKLRNVNRNIALGQVLQKAGVRTKYRHRTLNLDTEQEEHNTRKRTQKLSGQLKFQSEVVRETRRERAVFLLSAIAVATTIFILFYLFVRPSLLKRDQQLANTNRRVEYLEKYIYERRNDGELKQLWQDYLDKFSDPLHISAEDEE